MQERMTISREVTDEFANLVRQALEERFKGEFIFDPIEVEPAIDHYGDEHLDTYIVFEGDEKKLDSRWTTGLSVLLGTELDRLGIFNVPVFHYVLKDEWEKVFHGKHPRANEPW